MALNPENAARAAVPMQPYNNMQQPPKAVYDLKRLVAKQSPDWSKLFVPVMAANAKKSHLHELWWLKCNELLSTSNISQ